jgi:hypothetical protein
MDKSKQEPDLWTSIFMFALLFISIVSIFPVAYLRGYVALKLWNWFGAPLVPTVHPTIHLLVGVMILLGCFQTRPSVTRAEGFGVLGSIAANIAFPLALWGFGYIWMALNWGN